MPRDQATFERAMKLAVVTGLKCMMGPALVSVAHNRPERRGLVAAALGEMVFDKLPFVPNRSSLPLLLPRAIAGYWVTKQVMEREGIDDPMAAPIGAAVAAGTATFAPMLRNLLSHVLGIPNPVLGLAEDYLALKLGGEAVGLSLQDLQQEASDSLGDVKDRMMPAVSEVRERLTAQ